ncbi:MAG: Eco47II family restriction endonuclease [Gammaproteobacteria bacterium]|nr:Eco47II family restriction endonuclease [Gammaproteobacteria bacterium]
MSSLLWIDDGILQRVVLNMLERAQKASDNAPKNIKKNVIDPFSSLILAAATGISEEGDLTSVQQVNSASSGISNAIGNFHQQILGSVRGFNNHDSGYDLECAERRILAEVKNKHNTMNGPNREKVVSDLDTAVKQKAGNWIGYLVIIIPAKPVRYKKRLTRREVYEIDGASFYELATGHAHALHDLYYAVEDIAAERYPELRSRAILHYCNMALRDAIPE